MQAPPCTAALTWCAAARYNAHMRDQMGHILTWPHPSAGYKALVDLVVLDPATLLPTNSCDLQPLAKDGVYLMEIPRQ